MAYTLRPVKFRQNMSLRKITFIITSYLPSQCNLSNCNCLLYSAALQEKKSELPVAESRAVKILADNVKEQDKTDELREEWALAANVLNRFFIWLFLISVVITLIAVFAVDTRFET